MAVEIYTENLYLTNDIDMVNTNYQPPARLQTAMADLGFYKKGRVYANPTTEIVVEFPSAPLSVGDELIRSTTRVQVADKSIPILIVTDVVKDRLAAFMHWQDRQSLVQAVAIMLKHQLNAADFRKFCEKEGSAEGYELLAALYQGAVKSAVGNMLELERMLTRLILSRL